MGKHFSNLSIVSDEKLNNDLQQWEEAWIKARTKEGEEKAREIVNELREELYAREDRQRSA